MMRSMSFMVAERVIIKPKNELTLKDKLWNVLEERGRDGSWETIEKMLIHYWRRKRHGSRRMEV